MWRHQPRQGTQTNTAKDEGFVYFDHTMFHTELKNKGLNSEARQEPGRLMGSHIRDVLTETAGLEDISLEKHVG